MVNKGLNFFLYISLIFVSLTACKKRNLILNSSAKIELSADTIIFDTVFTQRGTITKHCKLYNPHRQPINISELYIAGMNDSLFRMNVDGISGSYHENIEIKEIGRAHV